jgi:hypothetical protein
MTKLIIYRDKKREYRWRMTRKGRIVAESGEGYKRMGGLRNSLLITFRDVRRGMWWQEEFEESLKKV